MAGDWIKMRIDLQTHPKVVRIMSAMRPHDVRTVTDKFRVIGALHAVWGVFDTHSEDGVLRGYTPEALDHIIGLEGIAQAMIGVDWLSLQGPETLYMPEFHEHNGQSAKRRAEDQKRKREERRSKQDVRNLSGTDADKSQTREEKEKKEEISTTSVTTDSIPYSDIVDTYHERLPTLPRVRKLNDTRKRKLRACWREDAERQQISYWRDFFDYVAKSDFLTGRNGQWTGCDFEWLIKASNHLKVIEGKYDNRDAA